MKKILSLLMVAMLVAASLCLPASAESTIAVLVDDSFVTFDVSPTIIEDRTMVPVRAIFEALGATVDWIEETSTVISNMGDTEVRLKINDKVLYKNNTPVELDVPAQLLDGRTLVPVRAISEAYGCNVRWNAWTKTVLIVSDLEKTAIATVNGEPVSPGYFNFVLSQAEAHAMQNYGATPDDLKAMWYTTEEMAGFGEYLTNSAIEQCVYIKANAQQAKQAGIVLSDTAKAEIKAVMDQMVEAYGEKYETFLSVNVTTPAAIEEYYTDNKYAGEYLNKLVEEKSMSNEEVKKYLDENYIKAKHILFSTIDNQTGASLPEEEVLAKKALAEDTLKRIKKGENFDALMKKHGEDPGVESNPDGYLFTKGEMVAEFEATAFALPVGHVSEIVETRYGYHIIKRVENGAYAENEINAIKGSFAGDEAYAIMENHLKNASVTQSQNLLAQTLPVGIE